MTTLFPVVIALTSASALPVGSARGVELLGYLENWVDVKWWDNDIPGNCLMGCFNAAPLIEKTKPYSAINYGFAFLTQNPSPDQVGCGTAAPAGPCPEWDGQSIYLSQAGKQGSHAVDASTTLEESSPGAIAIAEVVRMARMHPDGPKRAKIALGGWSDYARLCSVENGKKAAALMGKLVQITFADGVDLDFEHLTPFDNVAGCNEFAAFQSLITNLRTELSTVAANWVDSANARKAALQKQFDDLEPYQKATAYFYNSSILYLGEVASNPPPHMEISWTTRFNAYVPTDDPWNYVADGASHPNATYETDNEGAKIYGVVADDVDTVNIMAYDGDGFLFNYDAIFDNFEKIGKVPLSKVNMGFEPGEQAGSGKWEGLDKDKSVAQYVKDHEVGGVMLWGVNPSPQTNPEGAKLCPQTAQALKDIVQPTYAWGPAPKYTKCDPQTGWVV